MKNLLLIIFITNIISSGICKAQIQTDPVLTAAVELQTLELKNAYDKRNKTQEKIIAAQGAISLAMDRIHSVESKVLEYMRNASAAMDNLYQLKKAAELVSEKIPLQMKKMVAAVPANFEGTAVTALTTKTCSEVITEMTSLYGFMSELVTSTNFSLGNNSDSDNGKKNVNLLSTAERYYIANEVVFKLQRIYRKLWLITWQIENLGWEDALHNLDPKTWAVANHGKAIAERLIKQWENTKFK